MKLIKIDLERFVNEIDSKAPTPGGGSVSAYVSTMGVSLAKMVGHLTVGKKRFLALDDKIKLEFEDILKALVTTKEELLAAVDKDTDAFNLIMKAFRLPKETEEQIEKRAVKIQEGTLEAILIPLEVASLSISALHHLPYLLKYGNKNTVSDLGVATLSLATGLEGACMNVMINLSGLDDKIAAKQFKIQIDQMIKTGRELREEILEVVYRRLNK